jgi:hypothetical protein
MKPITVESPMGLDRVATWNEVVCAMSSSSRCTIRLTGRRDDSSEMDSDFRGRTGNLSEEDMWLAFASELLDSKSN